MRATVLLLTGLVLGCPGTSPVVPPDTNSTADQGPVVDYGRVDAGASTDGPQVDGPRVDGPQADVLLPDLLQPDLAPVSFTDVPAGHPQAAAIYWVAQQGIMIGCQSSPPAFCPDNVVKRSEVAVTLVRMKYGESFGYSKTPHFTDVPSGHWAFKYVQKLYDDGVTNGCGGGKYCPDDGATRGQGAVFLVKTKYGDSFGYSQSPHFGDVPATHWAFKYVQKLYDDGVTNGCGSGNYCPDDVMPRKHWAVFLYNAKTL